MNHATFMANSSALISLVANIQDLFPCEPLYLPPISEEETLYSWCARYHHLSSNSSSRQTSRQLFAHPSAGMRSDFPVQLDTLVARTSCHLGSAPDIIFKRTVFGAFAPFLDASRTASTIASMCSGEATRIKSALGLLASRIGTPAPLKACRNCMREELSVFHTTRWHWEHQLPAVRICSKHGEVLLVANDHAHVRAHHDWLLPHDLNTNEWHENPPVTQNGLERLNSLVEWSRKLTIDSDAPFQPFDPDILRDTCHLRAQQMGWVAIDGSLRFKEIRNAFHAAHIGLEALPGLSFLGSVVRETGGFIGILLRQYGRFQHPLKHLFLLSFLFESPDEFQSTYQESASTISVTRREPMTREKQILTRKLNELVADQGMSVNRAAQLLGINVKLAIAYLRKAGTAYRTRPRVVGTDTEAQLVTLLENGDDAHEIARALGIRQSLIRGYLVERPALRAVWAERSLARRREAYRKRFLELLTENPLLPIKHIRRLPNSGFEWLYRRDRDWLAENLPGIWHR